MAKSYEEGYKEGWHDGCQHLGKLWETKIMWQYVYLSLRKKGMAKKEIKDIFSFSEAQTEQYEKIYQNNDILESWESINEALAEEYL